MPYAEVDLFLTEFGLETQPDLCGSMYADQILTDPMTTYTTILFEVIPADVQVTYRVAAASFARLYGATKSFSWPDRWETKEPAKPLHLFPARPLQLTGAEN